MKLNYETLVRMYEDLEVRHGKVCHELAMSRLEVDALRKTAPPLHITRHEIYEEAQGLEQLRKEKRYDEADAIKKEIERKYRVRIIVGTNKLIVREAT